MQTDDEEEEEEQEEEEAQEGKGRRRRDDEDEDGSCHEFSTIALKQQYRPPFTYYMYNTVSWRCCCRGQSNPTEYCSFTLTRGEAQKVRYTFSR